MAREPVEMTHTISFTLLTVALLMPTSIRGQSPDSHKVLKEWLSQHPTFRVATDADCNCAGDIATMRRGVEGESTPRPEFHPYSVTGDFNGDGVADLAVAVIDKSKQPPKNFSILVFNGPLDSGETNPAYLESDLDLRYEGLFFGAPLRGMKSSLVIGRFDSDNTYYLVPWHGGYKAKMTACC
jgi:hypothetical protein